MGHIIADLKETFRRGNIFIQLIYINVGIFVIGTLINVFLRLFEVSTPRYIRYICPAGILYRIYSSAVVVIYLYVYACRHPAYSIQYALAVLVRKFVSLLFLGKTFKRFIRTGRYLWRVAVYGCLQCISFIQLASSGGNISRSIGLRVSHRSCHSLS